MTTNEPTFADAYPYAPQQAKEDTSVWAIVAFCAAVFFALCSLTATLASIPLAGEFANGETWDTVSVPVALVQGGSAVLAILAMIGSYVVSCVWLVQARRNALLISPLYPQRHLAWLWVGWWLPIANLFMPFKVVRDIVDGSVPRDRHDLRAGSLLGWWWACWLVMVVLERVHSSVLDNAGNTGGDSAGAVQVLAGLLVVVTVAGLALWGLIIRRVVDFQNQADLAR